MSYATSFFGTPSADSGLWAQFTATIFSNSWLRPGISARKSKKEKGLDDGAEIFFSAPEPNRTLCAMHNNTINLLTIKIDEIKHVIDITKTEKDLHRNALNAGSEIEVVPIDAQTSTDVTAPVTASVTTNLGVIVELFVQKLAITNAVKAADYALENGQETGLAPILSADITYLERGIQVQLSPGVTKIISYDEVQIHFNAILENNNLNTSMFESTTIVTLKGQWAYCEGYSTEANKNINKELHIDSQGKKCFFPARTNSTTYQVLREALGNLMAASNAEKKNPSLNLIGTKMSVADYQGTPLFFS